MNSNIQYPQSPHKVSDSCYQSKKSREKLLSGQKPIVKLGIDPVAFKIHIHEISTLANEKLSALSINNNYLYVSDI